MHNKKLIRLIWVCLGILLLLPFSNTSAVSGTSSFEVNPLDYEINVQVGDSRIYLVDHIHQSFIDEYGYMVEMHEMQFPLIFNGTEENVTINEGTTITVEVMEITNESIRVKVEYYTLDGPSYYPDDYIVNRSSLELLDEKNVVRLIMTTNHTLIDSVFQGSEWNYELYDDRMRFDTGIWNETYNSWEEIEYDGYSGFLRHMNLNYNYEDGWFSFSMHEIFLSDPNEYTLGISIGDMMTYTINKISFWDEGMNMYHNDFPVTVLQNGEYHQYMMQEGDSFELEVMETEGVYLKLKVTYYLKEGQVQDESLIILDKSTGYFSSAVNPGYMPPMILTTNQDILWRFLPMNYEVINGELIFSDSWEDPGRAWKQSEKGIWNMITGWMKYYNREEYENEKLTHQFELVSQSYNMTDDTNTTVEFPIGVAPGDTNILEFTTISMKDENGSLTNVFHFEIEENGHIRVISVTEGDHIEVIIKDVVGSEVTMYMKINSSIDGNIVTDPWTIDLTFKDENMSGGPPLLVPNDFQAVEKMFGDKGDVTQVNDEFHVKMTHDEENETFVDEFVYDSKTGWVLSISQSVIIDGEPQLILLVNSLGYSTATDVPGEDNSSSLPSLTPVPLWPTLIFLVAASLVYRKRR